MALFIYNEKCKNCGNNPVPHFANWYFESLNVLLAPVRRILLYNPVAVAFKRLFSTVDVFLRFIKILVKLGAIVWETDVTKCRIRRAQVLWEEAERKGLVMKQAVLLKKPIDIYSVIHRGQEIIFSGLPRPLGYDNSSLDWMDDKQILKLKFSKSGLPVPLGGSAWTFSQAKKIFGQVQKSELRITCPPSAGASGGCRRENYELRDGTRAPVIVKPRAGSRGRHSTTYVSNLEDLKKAYKIAKQLCFWVVVEEQLFGPVYRATVINYELCGVLRGDSPQVIGDGAHTIRELVEIKNNQRHQGVKNVVVDEGMEKFIDREIFNFHPPTGGSIFNEFPNINFQNLNVLDWSIPKDVIVQLSEKIGVSYGGSSSEDFEICHEDNKRLFVQAAKIVSDPIVGFDFMIPDITKSWKEQKCGFIEANSLPFINLHHDPLLGTPKNVAKKVWAMMEKEFEA